MNEFSTPAVVAADPEANITDLLVDRVAQTPDSVLFALPTADGGWSRRHDARVPRPGRRAGEGPRRRRHRAGRQDRPHVQDALRVDAHRLRHVVRGRRAGSRLRDELAGADAVEPHRLRRHRRHPRDRRPLRPVRRGAPRPPGRPQRLADRPRRPRQAGRGRRRRYPTRRSSAAATSPSAPTSRPSSTPPARPASPRAASSPTRTSSRLSRNAAVALNEVVLDPDGASTLLFITTAHVFARFISVLSVHAGVQVGHQPDTKQLLPVARQLQADVPARRAARVREGLQRRPSRRPRPAARARSSAPPPTPRSPTRRRWTPATCRSVSS